MIFAWLGAKALFGLSRGIWLLGAVVLLVGAVVWLQARENADDKANQDIGRTIEREESTREVLERTEQGNEAREDMREAIRTGDPAAYAQCVRTARTPANCVRFLPERPAD